uniref:MBTPS1 fourth domain-containing protein n=1 Tax=Compsopogon caeruleus TaxID=31354 RepID=A0A7S1XEB2_9RHOD|mmetsp:Transcript_2977/g.5692  ORF Transcript_2977/g.5692 Transcript_2977/m.5692 type:complete len:457 (+) Transcript_2977:1-1371(+)
MVLYGVLKLAIESVTERVMSVSDFPVRLVVIRTPPRENRILWDLYHSLRYPPAYIPRDSLSVGKDMLDWLGDHPHTNFEGFYRKLRDEGFFIEVWDQSFTCLTPHQLDGIGFLFLIDSEDFFHPDEISMIHERVINGKMSLVVAAEWFNSAILNEIGFMDDNTRSFWKAVIGGGNVPALNMLLGSFNVSLGDDVISGSVGLENHRFPFRSGTPITRLPAGSEVIFGNGFTKLKSLQVDSVLKQRPIVLAHVRPSSSASGSVLVYGDTFCLDSIRLNTQTADSEDCYSLFVDALRAMNARQRISSSTFILDKEHEDQDSQNRNINLSPAVMAIFRPHSRVLRNVNGGDSPVFGPVPECFGSNGPMKPTMDETFMKSEGKTLFEKTVNRTQRRRNLPEPLYDSFMSIHDPFERHLFLLFVSFLLSRLLLSLVPCRPQTHSKYSRRANRHGVPSPTMSV